VSRGQGSVVVARFHDLALRFAQELADFDIVEGRLGHHLGHQVDQSVERSRDDVGVEGDDGRGDVGRDLRPERVDGLFELVRAHPAAAAPQHAHHHPREPFLANRVRGRPRSQGDRDAHHGKGATILDEDARLIVGTAGARPRLIHRGHGVGHVILTHRRSIRGGPR
jgi:hypothetical protein